MNYSYTDGKNKDFISLCGLLDAHLVETFGAKKQEGTYNQYNTLGSIHDVIIAYDGDDPVGCGSFKQYEEGTAEIKRVFVKSEYRGKGISKQIMNMLEEKAIEQGFTALILETGYLLSSARSLYQKMGFTVIDNYGQYKGMIESVCMQKKIGKKC